MTVVTSSQFNNKNFGRVDQKWFCKFCAAYRSPCVDATVLRVDNTVLRVDNTVLCVDNTVLRVDNTVLRVDNTVLRWRRFCYF